MSFRIKSVDVKHSETIVTHCSNGAAPNVKEAYPLRTDITAEMRLWTKGGAQQTESLNGLRETEEINWY